MSNQEPRIPAVTEADWTDEMRDLFEVMEGPEAREKGPSREIIKYLAQHPVLSTKFLAFGSHLLFHSSLPDRERELVTLYVAWKTKSDYEWISHVPFGLHVGVTAEEIHEVKKGPSSDMWSDKDRDLLVACDQYLENYCLDDELWASLSREWSTEQMVELLFTIGNYMLFSGVLNTLRIPLEAGTEDFVKNFGLPD
ncbi:carboxymuconolactone decarboxylase family protein [Emcibacter nanhaiensis]|uniref:Carboxymuconolactone decarboxylase family protein n=1 Tax=Emcibacter nanhaiensis TaxID=1505037 RepID=A0A501PUW0_9PROT|nr:carboxymuconolactone decarboxylase family protein [Emcibacter nanhaiensis]TPD63784.1 carboxymuconolactone decarboxylase family protein [Emcibacter nanhaiensis]